MRNGDSSAAFLEVFVVDVDVDVDVDGAMIGDVVDGEVSSLVSGENVTCRLVSVCAVLFVKKSNSACGCACLNGVVLLLLLLGEWNRTRFVLIMGLCCCCWMKWRTVRSSLFVLSLISLFVCCCGFLGLSCGVKFYYSETTRSVSPVFESLHT